MRDDNLDKYMRHEPPAEFFELVGRIVLAASSLEFGLSTLVSTVLGEPEPAIFARVQQTGATIRAFEKLISQRQAWAPTANLGWLHERCAKALDERSGLIHSVRLFQSDDDDEADVSPILVWPKRGTERPPPSVDELRGLLARIEEADWVAFQFEKAAADYMRTDEATS